MYRRFKPTVDVRGCHLGHHPCCAWWWMHCCLALFSWGLTVATVYADELDAGRLDEGTYGVHEGAPFSPSVLLFVDGRYVEAPYVVSRRGLAVLVNGIIVEREWPGYVRDLKWPDPELPPGVDAKTSFDAMIPIRSLKYKYLNSTYPAEEAEKRYFAFLRSLPMVKSVRILSPTVGDYGATYEIALADGTVTRGGLGAAFGIGTTIAEVVGYMETLRTKWEQDLTTSTQALFLQTVPGEDCKASWMGREWTGQQLTELVRAISHAASREAAREEMTRSGLLEKMVKSEPNAFVQGQIRTCIESLLERFVPSKQLDERLEKLAQEPTAPANQP